MGAGQSMKSTWVNLPAQCTAPTLDRCLAEYTAHVDSYETMSSYTHDLSFVERNRQSMFQPSQECDTSRAISLSLEMRVKGERQL